MKKVTLIIMSIIAMQLGAQTITNYTTTDGLLDNFVECIDVDINDNVWIGTNSIIESNIKIGENCVIGSFVRIKNSLIYNKLIHLILTLFQICN